MGGIDKTKKSVGITLGNLKSVNEKKKLNIKEQKKNKITL
jgi:hypothetical protein